MALYVLDSGSRRRVGCVCRVMATDHQADAAFHGLYVQGHELGFCPVDFGVSFWRSHYDKQPYRIGDYHYRDSIICQGIMYKLLVIVSVLAAAGAQMLLKRGAQEQYPSFIRQYLNLWVIGGYGIMGCSLLLNIFCMRHGVQVKEVSIIESLSYLFVPCLSWLFFKEKITWRKAGGIVVIMMGMVVFFM